MRQQRTAARVRIPHPRIQKQYITSAQTKDGVAYTEGEVAEAIVSFFSDWMGSVVGVEKRWGGATVAEAWDNMMNMDTNQIPDPETRRFVETAYLRSFKHYTKMQHKMRVYEKF